MRIAFLVHHHLRQIVRCYSTNVKNVGPRQGDKVVVAMSGGVDSSVTAALLVNSPMKFNVSAIFMRNWDMHDESGSDRGCEWEKDWEDVQQVCKVLGIPHRMIDLSKHYWNRVFEPALQTWKEGRTPNPDVSCNREIKFGVLIDHLNLGNNWLATGHYAQIIKDSDSDDPPKLLRAIDEIKDQSYWLSSVPAQKFQRVLFPLGNLTKAEVRRTAEQFGLPTAKRRESMGICFVGKKRDFSEFLEGYITPQDGNIVTIDGKVMSRHHGLWQYTIGQNARIAGMPRRMFVAYKNYERNEVVVVDDPHHPSLMISKIEVKDFHWIWETHPPIQAFQDSGLEVGVRFRSTMQPVPAVLRIRNGSRESGSVTFQEPQQAVAPGQIAAVYLDSWCLGCGVIDDFSSIPLGKYL